MKLVKLTGAQRITDDDGRPTYEVRGDIFINLESILCFYDHTVIVEGHQIRVMESLEELQKIITREIIKHNDAQGLRYRAY